VLDPWCGTRHGRRRLGRSYLHYISIPVRTAAPSDEQVKRFLEVTNDPEIFPLFIQCASGNRVGAFWMIRRVLVDGWTVVRAEEEAKQIGARARPQRLLEAGASVLRPLTVST
jgi:protein tyrosine phosphatase (PTP) superfamily phosphohydrolase (DUF442 family)